jgi:anaerobic selenocysteine-containing dehydrogenase
MADLILPDHTYLEKMDDIVWPTGLQYPLYGLSKPVVAPIYDTRNTGDVLIQLAKGIGNGVSGHFPWENYEEVLKVRAKGLFDAGGGLVTFDGTLPVWEVQKKGANIASDVDSFDDMYAKLKSGGLWYRPGHTYGGWAGLFKTPTGKFEFSSSKIELALKERGTGEQADALLMPHYRAPSSEGDSSAYPLTMVPYEMINLASGWVPSPPFLNKTLFDDQLLKNDSFAEINPGTAAEYGLEEGDRMVIQSRSGKIRVRAHLFEGAMPGVVYLPLGFGHTAYDDFLRGKGANPNDIVHPEKEPVSGYAVWWRTPVKVTKA